MSEESEDEIERSTDVQKLLPIERGAFEIEGPPKLIGWREIDARIKEESKIMWEIAGPAILTLVAQFSIGFITAAYAGHLGEVELAAVSVVQNVIEGFVYGVMVVIVAVGGALLARDGKCPRDTLWPSCWSRPVPYARNIPAKVGHYHSSDSTVSYPCLSLHLTNAETPPSQQTDRRRGRKICLMDGSTIVCLCPKLSCSEVPSSTKQVFHVVSGYFPEAWTGLSSSAFKSLFGFLKLSLASAVMLCLEIWYSTAIILMVGWLPNPKLAVDAISICMNIEIWILMITLGFNAAISVRVSNELGAGNPKATKFSIAVTVATSTLFGIIFAAATIATKNVFPKMFTSEPTLIKETTKLGYFLAAIILLNSVQPVLHGVAIGAGWQTTAALINIVCYYIIGLPIGSLLGFEFDLGVKGIWLGLLTGIALQTAVLFFILCRTNWSEEALQAEERIRSWSSSPSPLARHPVEHLQGKGDDLSF